MTGCPDKEYGTNKPPPTRRVRERWKGDAMCPPTSQNPSRQHSSWLSDACATRKDPELEWLAKDHPETNPITIKPETVSYAAEQFSWVSLPYSSPRGCPFPIKSLALSAHVSPWTIHFWVLDKSPASGPGRGPPSCNAVNYRPVLHNYLHMRGNFHDRLCLCQGNNSFSTMECSDFSSFLRLWSLLNNGQLSVIISSPSQIRVISK